jgi:hypothetical protein
MRLFLSTFSDGNRSFALTGSGQKRASGGIEKRDCFDLHMRNAGLGFVRDARSRLGSLGSGILSLDWNQKKKKEAGSKAETTPLITEPASSVL